MWRKEKEEEEAGSGEKRRLQDRPVCCSPLGLACVMPAAGIGQPRSTARLGHACTPAHSSQATRLKAGYLFVTEA